MTGDALKLRQVLENLLRNAIESFEESPRAVKKIIVSIDFDDDNAHIRIEDNGAGMKPGTTTRIFDPFFTTKAHGTGLGLSIAKEIVHAHHGELTLEAARHGGTVAHLVLSRRLEDQWSTAAVKAGEASV